MTTQIPDLGYPPVPDIFKLPAGVNFGPCSGVAVNAKNNVLVFNRSENALMEFTSTGDYVRTMGRGVFTNPHGLRIDREGNIWCTNSQPVAITSKLGAAPARTKGSSISRTPS